MTNDLSRIVAMDSRHFTPPVVHPHLEASAQAGHNTQASKARTARHGKRFVFTLVKLAKSRNELSRFQSPPKWSPAWRAIVKCLDATPIRVQGAGPTLRPVARFAHLGERAFERRPQAGQSVEELLSDGGFDTRASRHVLCIPYDIQTVQVKKSFNQSEENRTQLRDYADR